MDGVDWLLITALDEVAWTLNFRGTDITYNPVFFSYLAFNCKTNKSILYIDNFNLSAEVMEGCTVQPYLSVETDL